MTLDQTFEQARTLESAEVHAASYMGSFFPVKSAAMKTENFSEETVATSAASSSSKSQKFFVCGNDLHSQTLCSARDVTCRKCEKKGHYQHLSVEIGSDGNRPPLTICSLAVVQEPPVTLFSNLNPDCRPLITKLRCHTVEDNILMAWEVQKLLQEGVLEPSNSPWRAQAFVIRGENHKPKMVVDYSQTINKYTLLDAYPLPKIEEDSKRHYTAFEACGKLYQFLRVPFGVTNGAACFQRVIDKIIEDEGLALTYLFIDDVTVCEKIRKNMMTT
ncbi:putative retrovirus-related pol polyprotein from transposon opus [Trichonephila clavipes]|nr:putative retrovirus-related pol polyprotein from transposon opus [Trichonephila clavipes]